MIALIRGPNGEQETITDVTDVTILDKLSDARSRVNISSPDGVATIDLNSDRLEFLPEYRPEAQ